MAIRPVTFDRENDKVKVHPNRKDLELLEVKPYHRVYFGQPPYQHITFKLHEVQKIPNEYRWFGMNNSVVWASVDGISSWNTVEEALKLALKNGWAIVQANQSDLKKIERSLLKEWEKRT